MEPLYIFLVDFIHFIHYIYSCSGDCCNAVVFVKFQKCFVFTSSLKQYKSVHMYVNTALLFLLAIKISHHSALPLSVTLLSRQYSTLICR